MEPIKPWRQFLDWFEFNLESLLLTLGVFVIWVVVNRVISSLVARAETSSSRQDAALKAMRGVRLVTGFIGSLAIMVVWGIEFSNVAIFATTTITLLGVALFASWSVLSNVTAYFVLLFHPKFTRGTFVRILEVDNYVEGYIADLTLLSIQIVTEDQTTILYPNNLLLGRVAIVNPKDRLNGIGKIVNPPDSSTVSVPAPEIAAPAGEQRS